MSAGEAKKLKNKLRKQQMREQQEKQKQIEAERRKKESQRHRNKDDGEEEKIKEEELVGEKLEHVNWKFYYTRMYIVPVSWYTTWDGISKWHS